MSELNGWIPVKDMLPKREEYVLTYGIDEYEIARYEPGSELWFNKDGRVVYPNYWQSLPEVSET